MIVVRVRTKSSFPKVRAKAKQGNINSLGHAGAAIRLAARRSIRKSNSASTEGQPPNTRQGQLRRSIMYAVDKGAGLVIIGHNTRSLDDQRERTSSVGDFGASATPNVRSWGQHSKNSNPVCLGCGQDQLARKEAQLWH